MISLKIQNFVLIEEALISFGPGLNIITGETGAGKSVLLNAIRLIRGHRADASLIREGAPFAAIEALFEDGSHVRRELYRSGKNRCFIDEAQVSLAELKEAVHIELISQNSSSYLLDEQLNMLDSFGNLKEIKEKVDSCLNKEKRLRDELEDLKTSGERFDLGWTKKELEWISEIDGFNEKELSSEHNLLSNSYELSEKTGAASYLLGQFDLKAVLIHLEKASSIDPNLAPLLKSFKEAKIELEEISCDLERYFQNIEASPQRLEEVEKSLKKIEQAKKRFGPNLQEEKEKLIQKIDRFESLDEKIESLKEEIQATTQKNEILKKDLTLKRKNAAKEFSYLILKQVQELNLPDAAFEIEVKDEFNQITFLFSANQGQSPKPLSECASGGELSRLFLAIKTILTGGASTLVFDEIDSNVGGQSALVLGQKLKELSQTKQIICVTHFVQVAKSASSHFLVRKTSKNNQTFTELKKLSEKEKELEYLRMLGQK